MAAHAKLSPSASARWMTCPGSVSLIDKTPSSRSGSSKAAQRGTAIHEMSEHALETGHSVDVYLGRVFSGVEMTKDDIEIARIYVDYVRKAVGDQYYEQKVSVESVVDDCYGTADAVVARPGHIAVIDLKTGGGEKVTAKDNTQLLIYALGAYYKFDWIYDINELTLVIVQPPFSEEADEWRITTEELLDFEKVLIESVERLTTQSDVFIRSQKACKWCPVKHVCPEHVKIAHEAAASDFAKVVDDLPSWLEKLPALKQFIDAVQEEAHRRLSEDSTSVPGYKLVSGRSSRAWVDIKKVEEELSERLCAIGADPDMIFKTELLSPAQTEKALKKIDVDYDDLIVYKVGSPVIAPESDKRNALTSAAEDFSK